MIEVTMSHPASILFQQPVARILAESPQGSFCILPRHTDYLTPLVPGIIVFTDAEGGERYFANNHGLLVKRGRQVFITVHHAVPGENLGSLRQSVRQHYQQLNESDRQLHSAVARLEASFLRKFLAIQEKA
jgi:F-type H+-transporting ATPase subunit epsilon